MTSAFGRRRIASSSCIVSVCCGTDRFQKVIKVLYTSHLMRCGCLSPGTPILTRQPALLSIKRNAIFTMNIVYMERRQENVYRYVYRYVYDSWHWLTPHVGLDRLLYSLMNVGISKVQTCVNL